MKLWILYGLLTALCWGLYAVLAKVVTDPQRLGVSDPWAGLLAAFGIAGTFSLYWLASPVRGDVPGPLATAAGSAVGVLWALGMIGVYLALREGAEIARLAPLYNANTIVAALAGMLVLGEAAARGQRLRVAVGVALVVAGSYLVTVPGRS